MIKFLKRGILFSRKGDEIIYVYPRYRKTKMHKWISLGFSGNGDFGDAYFPSLKKMDEEWDAYFEARKKHG
jgi:hypothetical protein